ncbi:MAG: hypothetical protein RR866_00545, partial [Raoultibacter sp.]
MARTRNTSPKNSAANSSAPSSPERGGVPAAIMGPRLLLAFAVFALVLIGLVMVYSASSIVSIDETGGATS